MALAACLLIATAHSWSRFFLIDDAFISFRYARHLVEGAGLVFNPGDRVEGYTNFLWTLLAAGALRAGWDPGTALPILSILASAVAIGVVYRWGRDLGLTAWAALIPPAMLAVNRSWAAWATGGLETRLFTLLVLVTGWRIHRERDGAGSRLPLSAIAAGLACLTRPEGWLVAAVGAASIAGRGVADGRWRRPAIWCASAGLIAGPHLVWRVLYYGDWVPNSFHAKVPGPRLASGAIYLALFGLYHLAAPIAAAGLTSVLRRWTPGGGAWRRFLLFTLPFTLGYLLYTMIVGGDHFEFRFMDPVLPLIYLMIVILIGSRFHAEPRAAPVAAILLIAGAAVPALTGFRDVDRTVTLGGVPRSVSIVSIETEVAYLRHWTRIGQWLGARAGDGESIAVAPAGAIPWYSGLRTLDMLGINDRAIAQMPVEDGLNIGHERMAGIELVRSRGITYLIGSPDIRHARSTGYAPDLVEVWFGDFYWYFRVLRDDAVIRPGSYR